MVPLWVALLLVVASLVVLLYQGFGLVLALQMPRLDPAPPNPGASALPSVSVVIAARNEELDLPATLDGFLVQDYPNLEIIVVEDGSTDRTREVIDARAPRVRRVDPPPLPPGWTGKNWACWNGARAASGDWILFADADIRTHPAAVRSAVEWALREHADLATYALKVEMRTFWERLVLPFYIQVVLTYFRTPHVNRPRSKTAMANGQFWLTPRPVYYAIGGHEAVRSIVLEDVAIARRYRSAGRTLRVAWTPELAQTRMYRNREEMFEGLLKNVHGTEFSAPRLVGSFVGLIGLFLLPLALLPFGLLTGSLGFTLLGGFLYFALFGKHVVFARSLGAPAAYGLLYPVAVGYYVVLVATSLGRGLRRKGVAWKGRSYPMGP
ncbi:MAG TPA: glycosyltransferase family 2 protein [Thermoplasmata archaeon]|nr:glycosyltransferase family 2 protein [Thermoplasmata archaeon]